MSQPHANQTEKVDRATETETTDKKPLPNLKYRLALWFSVHGELRYLSHRDTMELWRRLLVRAGLPLRFSQGFNPHPKITLPLPRSVGMSSENELLLVELNENPPAGEVIDAIRGQCPAGIVVNEAEYVPNKIPAMPLWAEYCINLSEQADLQNIQNKIGQLNEASQWNIERASHGRHLQRTLDLKQYISHLEMRAEDNQNKVWCKINIGETATPRIGEIQDVIGLACQSDVREITRVATGYCDQLQRHQSDRTNSGVKSPGQS